MMRPFSDTKPTRPPAWPAAAVAGAAVEGGEFADGIVVADDQFTAFPLKFLVLRIPAQCCMRMDLVVAADPCRPGYHAMWSDLGTFADADIGTDDGVWSNAYTGVQLRGRIDDCRWMDAHASPSAQRMSAQATCLPLTQATPW